MFWSLAVNLLPLALGFWPARSDRWMCLLNYNYEIQISNALRITEFVIRNLNFAIDLTVTNQALMQLMLEDEQIEIE